MRLNLLYFASLRERLQCDAEQLDVPAGVTTIGELRTHLASRGAPWTLLLEAQSLKSALNQQMVGADALLAEGDEVAFFPPVTGG